MLEARVSNSHLLSAHLARSVPSTMLTPHMHEFRVPSIEERSTIDKEIVDELSPILFNSGLSADWLPVCD